MSVQWQVIGIAPVYGSEADLPKAVAIASPGAVLVCSGVTYGAQEAIGSALAQHDLSNWLQTVAHDSESLVLMRVEISADRAEPTPNLS